MLFKQNKTVIIPNQYRSKHKKDFSKWFFKGMVQNNSLSLETNFFNLAKFFFHAVASNDILFNLLCVSISFQVMPRIHLYVHNDMKHVN